MFNLKPSEGYPEYWSEKVKVFHNKKGYWTIKEYYKSMNYLSFDYWEYEDINDEFQPQMACWRRSIHIPLSWNSFYIQFIYKHLGKCHKDSRSRFYIGRAKEEVAL